MNHCSYFKEKKITLIGLGVLGRGVGDAEFLAECGAELIVTDLKSEKELSESVERLKKYKNIAFVLGEHRMEDFKNRDMVITSAGTPLDSPYIAEARKNNIPVEMSTALFAALSGAYIIGVTGTRGKTTVAHLLYEILQKVGKKVFLGGNVRGVSTLAMLKEVKRGDYAVLELDSWQLQGFGVRKISPNMAIFTNFMPDHMNYYGGDMRAYWKDKEHIFAHQTENDYLITTNKITRYIEEFDMKRHIKGKVVIAEEFPKNWRLKILGEHNKQNCAIAIAAARTLSIPDEIIREIVEHFSGVSGRLEFLREVHGVKIYNDTTATTPDATIAALEALAPRQNSGQNQNKKIVLILGGADKGLDMSGLIKEIPKYCGKVILLPGTGTDNLRFKNADLRFKNVKNLKEAVHEAMNEAKKGDIILFSPAFASFGLFKNEFDRGEQFCNIVSEL
ncbi:MAG: UDP-N-acetylmuramoyl-L-alanine--D-glutamate ligase [Parcubacteria group bacterium]|nr:UDP-N-acetylmuramoyl-L-alanine--D-glutamate ligase [Parcubacteria group bacterium]